MLNIFANRILTAHKSFIREILKVTQDPEIISFAGGLPNPRFFPVEELSKAAVQVFEEDGRSALQYSTTEGYLPLRRFIADRYMKRYGMKVNPDEILITNGSQQGLDLIGKVLLDRGDGLIIERPGYLGAIQAFSMFEPEFLGIPIDHEGVDMPVLKSVLEKKRAKLFYTVSNFQNPSGITCSMERRSELAEELKQHGVILVEDDPYGELRFAGEHLPPIKSLYPEGTILLGSFSKIVAPGIRLGWIYAPEEIMEKLVIAKQASDLHSNYLSQRLLYRYLQAGELDRHIAGIREAYSRQCNAMVRAIERYFPAGVEFTRPEGGMFLWVSLPEGVSSMDLFETAIGRKVAFVPGSAFYTDGGGENTFRLNYSNCDEPRIEEGIRRLGEAIKMQMGISTANK